MACLRPPPVPHRPPHVRSAAEARHATPSDLRIPKVLHQLYLPDWEAYEAKTRDPASAVRWGWGESCRRIYRAAGWQIKFWGAKESEALLREHYPWFVDTWLNYTEVLWKSDGVRPFILHKYGGMYLDLDVECWVPAEEWLSGAEVVLQGTHPAEGHTNGILAGTASHPLWMAIARELEARAKQNLWLLARTTRAFPEVPAIANAPVKKGVNAFVGEWHLNDTTVKVHPFGQFFTPCWYNDNLCHRDTSLQRALGEIPEGLVGYHRYTGTWNAKYDRDLGVHNDAGVQAAMCDESFVKKKKKKPAPCSSS
eukprot:scaffold8.g1375.t1